MLNQAIAKGNQNLVASFSPAAVFFLLPRFGINEQKK
jgi:hypothetical protein